MKTTTKKRGTPKRAKKKPAARRQTTALTKPVTRVEVVQPPAQLAPIAERRIEAGSMAVGELGLVEIKFTPEEERILAEPVDETKVLIKPDGAPYLPHAEYTRWWNRAIGRGAWQLVPVGTPGLSNKTVVCPYVLFVHGRPIALAQGEQEYFEGNRNQSYGDALESTVASALRRCSKHLGVGLELWDRDWLNDWKARYAVRVQVKDRDGKLVGRWRRLKDRPLPFEVRGSSRNVDDDPLGDSPYPDPAEMGAPPASSSRRAAPAPAARAEDHRHTHAASGETITQKQRQRLWVIIRNSGREEQEVGAWLKRVLSIDDSRNILRSQYDRVCAAIESPADLPGRL